jgi:ubiquinone/menaquinone biosynthesis C-methylase UbiE
VTTAAEVYDTYLVPALFEPWAREVIQRAKVWSGDRALDVACGTGIVACRLAATGAKVTGADISADMLAQARRRAAAEQVAVTFVERPAEALRFPAASFDLVTCQQGLQFTADRAAAARELRRVVAPGGRAVVACWAALALHPAYVALDQATVRHIGPIGFAKPFSFGDEAALRALLTAARFHAVAVETVTRPVRFPDVETFVVRSLETILALVPELADLGPEARTERFAAATADVAAALGVAAGEPVSFATTCHLGVGRVKTDA